MPASNLTKYSHLINTIKNSKLSLDKREAALEKLQRQVDQFANTTLASFEKQLELFEQNTKIEHIEEILNNSLGFLDSDSAEVDALIQLISDEVDLDRRIATSSKQKLATPVNSKPEKLGPNPIDLKFMDDLKKLATLSLEEEFELALNSLGSTDNVPQKPPLTPPKSATKASPKPMKEFQTTKPNSLNTTPALAPESSLFESFVKGITQFVKAIKDLFEDKYLSNNALETTSQQLKTANQEFKRISHRLEKTQLKHNNAITTLQDRNVNLKSKLSELNNCHTRLQEQMKKLQIIEQSNMAPQDKLTQSQALKQQIQHTQQEYKAKSEETRQLSRQLTRATDKVVQVQQQLKEAIKAQHVSAKILDGSIKKLEKLTELSPPSQRIKELLHHSKTNYQEKHEKLASAENIALDITTKPKI